ncbi:hypothetical protein, partial [Bartonella sp. AC53GZZY]
SPDPVDPSSSPPDPLSTSLTSDAPSSTDSVVLPSAFVEPKPSESSDALEPSSNLSIPLDVP